MLCAIPIDVGYRYLLSIRRLIAKAVNFFASIVEIAKFTKLSYLCKFKCFPTIAMNLTISF